LGAPKQTIKLKRESRIRGLDISPSDGRVFMADYDMGDIYYYKSSIPMNAETPLELVATTPGPIRCRVIKYWKKRNELYLGCAKGRMTVYELQNFVKGATCKTLI
jgi:hypothetical protein